MNPRGARESGRIYTFGRTVYAHYSGEILGFGAKGEGCTRPLRHGVCGDLEETAGGVEVFEALRDFFANQRLLLVLDDLRLEIISRRFHVGNEPDFNNRPAPKDGSISGPQFGEPKAEKEEENKGPMRHYASG